MLGWVNKGMQKCRFNGKDIYAFNVIGKNDTINYAIEKEWKKAGEKNELLCDECEATVIFRCGKINKPHFAHKSEFQGGNPCKYSNETEEHIEGKKLLLNYMKELYPDVEGEMRRKLPERKSADLYFKFADNQELVIEFQRQRLSVSYWDDKREFYNKIGLNNIWLLSGKKEELNELIREYQLNFWNRMVLNDSDNRILFLDVDKEEVTIISKIIVRDDKTNEVVYDNLYNRTYPLFSIKILPTGFIECDFDEGYNKDKNEFVQAYLEQQKIENEKKERLRKALSEKKNREIEEKERLRKELEEIERLNKISEAKERKKKEDEEWQKKNADSFNQISMFTNENETKQITNKVTTLTMSGKNENSDKSTSKKSYAKYDRNNNYYRDKVNKAICGYKYGKENLVTTLINGGSSEYYSIKALFDEEISRGNQRAKNVFDEVMKLAGLD